MDFFYQELRNCAREISNLRKEQDTKEQDEKLANAVRTILAFAEQAKQGGLLSLEDAIKEMSDNAINCPQHFQMMIELVLDGTMPELIQEICLRKYFIYDLKAYEGLEYLLLLEGVQGILSAKGACELEIKLKSFLPAEVEKLYIEAQKKHHEELVRRRDNVERVCQDSFQWSQKDAGCYTAKILYRILEELSDDAVRKMMTYIDNHTAKYFLLGAPCNVKRKVFANVSPKLAYALADAVEQETRTFAGDIAEANQDVLNVFLKLYRNGEMGQLECKEVLNLFESLQ